MRETDIIIERVSELVAGYLAKNGIELIDVIYRREAGGMVLRLLVDTEEGINLDQCESINRNIGEELDREGIIEGHYVLEVSSPGLDRPLKTDRDFERAKGKDIVVHLYEPVNNKRTHDGLLLGVSEESIEIESSGSVVILPRLKIAKAVLKLEF